MRQYSDLRTATTLSLGVLLLAVCIYLPQLLAYSPSPNHAIAGALCSVGLWSTLGRRCFTKESPLRKLGLTSAMVVLGNACLVSLSAVLLHTLL